MTHSLVSTRTVTTWLCALMLACASFAGVAAEGDFVAVPKLVKRVTDLTGSLSAADEARIDAQLKIFEARKGAQIGVLIVDSTQPETAFDYAARVMTEWKLGRKGIDDGVLLVVAKTDRKMHLLTGPGISGSLTDAMSKRIISEFVAPKFRSGDYAGGIEAGVTKIIGVIDGEALPPPAQKRVGSNSGGGISDNFIFLAFAAAFFVGPILRAIFGRFLGASATGGITGAAAWFLAGGLALPIIAGVIVFFLVMFIGGASGGGRGGGWTSGGGGFGGWGGGGGGGGGGGFSGGGGSFDGGGASGDW